MTSPVGTAAHVLVLGRPTVCFGPVAEKLYVAVRFCGIAGDAPSPDDDAARCLGGSAHAACRTRGTARPRTARPAHPTLTWGLRCHPGTARKGQSGAQWWQRGGDSPRPTAPQRSIRRNQPGNSRPLPGPKTAPGPSRRGHAREVSAWAGAMRRRGQRGHIRWRPPHGTERWRNGAAGVGGTAREGHQPATAAGQRRSGAGMPGGARWCPRNIPFAPTRRRPQGPVCACRHRPARHKGSTAQGNTGRAQGLA